MPSGRIKLVQDAKSEHSRESPSLSLTLRYVNLSHEESMSLCSKFTDTATFAGA